MKTAKKLLAVLLSVVMLLGILPLSIMAEEADQGVWVAGVRVDNGTAETYWVNDGEGSIKSEGADAKNYNVKYAPGKLTLKNANLSKLYLYKEQNYTWVIYKYASVIYADMENLVITLEGKNFIKAEVNGGSITNEAGNTINVNYNNVSGIINGETYYSSNTTTIEGKGKIDINVSRGEGIKASSDAINYRGFTGSKFIIQGKPKITVSDCDTGFYSSGIEMYGGDIEISSNGRIINGSMTFKQFRDPKVRVSTSKDGEGTKSGSATSLTSSKNHYAKITTYSRFGELFLNTAEDLLGYLAPAYLMFVLEIIMQFPITVKKLLEKIIGSLL
ncbi:MAG: hypothetical protein IJF40_01615 [Clostridia bacterium]|nr:hypothetical protein [Clostridia bacterium]